LRNLFCSNNLLTSLLIQNGSFEDNFVIAGNTNLSFICADASEIQFVNQMLAYYTITNCTVTSNCNLETPSFEGPVTIKLFPNPATDYINFSEFPSDLKSITIYNSTGQLVKSIPNPSSTTLAISELKTGIYIVNFQLENSLFYLKFVKN
jgi:hypothetical protein